MHKFHYITKIRFIMSIKKAFMMAEHWLLIERQKFLHLVIVISCFLWKAVLLLHFIVCFFSQCFLLKELINQHAAMTLVKPQNWLPCLEFRKLVTSHSPCNFNHFYGSFRVEIDISSTPLQKKPVKGVIRKRCSKNMHQIYRRTPMPKCDFNKATLLKSYFGMGVLL